MKYIELLAAKKTTYIEVTTPSTNQEDKKSRL